MRAAAAGRVSRKSPSTRNGAAGTQSGDTVKLRGRGLPELRSGARGDIVARIFVEVPTKLDDRQRELLEELAKTMGDDVSPRRRGFLDKLRDLFE